jgi:hypothetical protein
VYFPTNQQDLLPELDDATIERASKMFDRLNALLPKTTS